MRRPVGLDPTSDRLVWTEVAWLSALAVGLSLLLTQLRLNRRRLNRCRQAAADGRPRNERTA